MIKNIYKSYITTIIRVTSIGNCKNSYDLTVTLI